MANTKTTIPISRARCGAVLFGVAMSVFAAINLFFTMTPVAKSNAALDIRFERAEAMPTSARADLLKKLGDDEVTNLAQRPSDPYGWARLSYLRLATSGDQKAAFAALFMSDFVSPYEAPELQERAVMWYRFHDVESPEQQNYQPVIWEKAYRMNRDSTWNIAAQNGLTQQVEDAFKKTNASFYGEWKDRELHPH